MCWYWLSYGERESQDVLSAYQFLKTKYNNVYAMGSSVGAASILIALPQMPDLAGAIVENPFTNFERLIKDAPEAQVMPDGFLNLLINLAEFRGGFNGQQNPENAILLSRTTPIFFIHSKEDKTASFRQTQELFDLYAGPKTVWFPEKGEHAAIWDANRAEYEKRVTDFLNGLQ